VQKPQFLLVLYSQCGQYSCPSGYASTTLGDFVTYQVLDANGNGIPIQGMTVVESTSNVSGTCPGAVNDSSQWTTDTTGTLTSGDNLFQCCPPGTDCGKSWNQSFTVDGYPVLITTGIANGLTGTHNVFQAVCNNGQASCPTLYPSP
jgi:hypothetical protein